MTKENKKVVEKKSNENFKLENLSSYKVKI